MTYFTSNQKKTKQCVPILHPSEQWLSITTPKFKQGSGKASIFTNYSIAGTRLARCGNSLLLW